MFFYHLVMLYLIVGELILLFGVWSINPTVIRNQWHVGGAGMGVMICIACVVGWPYWIYRNPRSL